MSKKSMSNICIWLLAALYVVLPTYFSFEISDLLPAFTGSRVILILCLIYIAFGMQKFWLPKGRCVKFAWIYVSIIALVNILHITDDLSYSVKAIFSLLFENIILIVVIFTCVRKRWQFEKFLRILVLTSSVVTILALIEFLTGYNIFYILTTTSRTIYQASYTRLGMTRAEASFGHSVYFGVYCSCMLPFSLFLYENLNKKRFLVTALLNIVGTVISGARGQLVACFVTVLLMFVKKQKKFKKKYIVVIIICALFAVLGMILVPAVFLFVVENIKSILNIVGFDFNISSNYGTNAEGFNSRIIQLSGLWWLIKQNAFLLGLGSMAHFRGLVYYYWASSGWQQVASIDVGYVGWFLQYGLIGAVGNLVLFSGFLIVALKKSNDKEIKNVYNPFKWFWVCYLLNLLSSTGVDKMLWIVMALMICYDRIEYKEKHIKGEQWLHL